MCSWSGGRTRLRLYGRWQQINRQIDTVINGAGLPCLPVSYERLCFDTASVKQEIEQFLGIEIAPYGDAAARAGDHSIFGNRMWFEPGKLREIRYDDG